MFGDMRDDWKLREIEQKADNANNRLHELDSLHGDVDRLERSNRELRSHFDGLRNEFQACLERLRMMEEAQNDHD